MTHRRVSRRLWRGELSLSATQAQQLHQATLTPPAAWPLPERLVVELVRERGAWLVMLSTTAAGDDALRSLMAFGERAERIDRLRELGFVATEAHVVARIDPAGGTLTVEVLDPQNVTGPAAVWLQITGARLMAPRVPPQPDAWVQRQRQRLASPAPEDPLRQVERDVDVDTARRQRRMLTDAATLRLRTLGAYDVPSLQNTTLALTRSCCARLDLPPSWLAPHEGPPPDPAVLAQGPVRRTGRLPLLQACGYRFVDVEIVGFRIDLSQRDDVDDVLQEMVDPLNFHRRTQQAAWGAQAFEWRPAARVLVIELLRYGRMYWGDEEPVPGEPWTAQHELLMRVLVGRVDDETAQARDPALFVPAIFVDNPWSRWIGRELQGYPKQLAGFYSDGHLLDLSGRSADGAPPVPLTRVDQVRLQPVFGDGHGRAGRRVLDLELPPGADEPAIWADVRMLMGHAGVRSARWRQGDFVHPSFRRGFAGQALGLDPARLPSVQVAPVDARAQARAWVEGTMFFDRMRAGMPLGVARLHLPRQPREPLPPAWRALSRLFPEGVIALPTGSWYRARADLRLEPGPIA